MSTASAVSKRTTISSASQHHLEASMKLTAGGTIGTVYFSTGRYKWLEEDGGLLGVTEALRLAQHLTAPLTHALKMQFYTIEALEDEIRDENIDGAEAPASSSSLWRRMLVGMRPEVIFYCMLVGMRPRGKIPLHACWHETRGKIPLHFSFSIH
jgi:hypothetical protein